MTSLGAPFSSSIIKNTIFCSSVQNSIPHSTKENTVVQGLVYWPLRRLALPLGWFSENSSKLDWNGVRGEVVLFSIRHSGVAA